MHTITKQYQVYNYDDLLQNEELKERVLKNLYDINVDDDNWYTDIIDTYKEKLENIGFINPEISFSGFYSQGDGASFTCNDIDFKKLAQYLDYTKREQNILYVLWNNGYIEACVKRTIHQYYHERTVVLDYYDGRMLYSWTHMQKIVTGFWDDVEKLIIDLSQQIYKDLESEYDYLTSDEAILETIQANEYEFFEDGTIA